MTDDFFFVTGNWIQEIPENGADLNHLDHLHSSPVLSGVDLRHIFSHWWQFARHNWSAEWKPLEDTKHVGCLQLVTSLSVFGYKIPYLDLHVAARQVGVHSQFRYKRFFIYIYIYMLVSGLNYCCDLITSSNKLFHWNNLKVSWNWYHSYK